MNTVKTFILLAGLLALFGGAGYLLGGEQGMMMALLFGAVMNFFAYWNADRMVLAMYGAQPVESGWLVEMVGTVAHRAGLPAPRVYIIQAAQPNAFATGRNPHHAAVAVTQGILDLLDERELRAVIGHELTHVKNRDTLIMTVTATIAGALSTLANFAMFFGTGSRERRSGPLATLILVVFAPLLAMLVQLAISRTREYEADLGSTEICNDPLALASALQKLEAMAAQVPNYTAQNHPGTAHMFIVNPLTGRGMDNLFSTHPSTENRIALLTRYAREEQYPRAA